VPIDWALMGAYAIYTWLTHVPKCSRCSQNDAQLKMKCCDVPLCIGCANDSVVTKGTLWWKKQFFKCPSCRSETALG
jgi:hypothetical protein